MFHQNCIIGGRRKFESQKLTNNYPIHTTLRSSPNQIQHDIETSINSQSVTIICDDSDDVIIETSSQGKVADAATSSAKSAESDVTCVDKRLIKYDETLCSVCNINRIDYSGDLDKAELNYMLKFVLHRIRAWVCNKNYLFLNVNFNITL